MREKRVLRRRAFLKQAGAGIAGIGAAPAILGALGAEEKLVFGVIGCGGRGSGHVQDITTRSKDPKNNIAIAGVCDVYRPRLERAAQQSGAKPYADYKALLDQKDIQCVIIATPDHWHAPMCIDAMKAGKDVYCEKPWTRTAEEAKECYQTVLKTKRILQVGTQHTADGSYWAAKDAIAAGKIGKVVWSQISYSRNSKDGEWNYNIDAGSSPENLDWDSWLGSAPKRPFNRERFFRFRKYWDYSGGIATDLHYHKLAPMLIAVGADFPRRVTSGGGIWVQKDDGQQSPREVPDTFMTIIDMPKEHTILLASSMASSSALPDLIRGHEATLSFGSGGIELRAENTFATEFKQRSGGDDVIRIPAQPRQEHMSNFIACVRSRRLEDLNCGPDLGWKTMVAIAMSVRAYREQKVLFWDPAKEEVTEKDPQKPA
jgi:predicted dehydrogenase